MNNGWVKLRRDTLENPIICKDNDHMAVWIYLLLNATHKEIFAIFGGEKITLKPGQLTTSINRIAKALNINRRKVERILIAFKSGELIGTQTDRRQSLITLDCSAFSQESCGEQKGHLWDTEQETENEKEKSSKREKEKEKEKYKNVRIYRGTPTYEKRGNGQPKIESTFDADEFFQAALERSNRKMMERRDKAAQG